jgi:hypothetical protein
MGGGVGGEKKGEGWVERISLEEGMEGYKVWGGMREARGV